MSRSPSSQPFVATPGAPRSRGAEGLADTQPGPAATEAGTQPGPAAPETDPAAPGGRPLRIQEAGEIVGLTPRSIRYYEELGLLSPSARSGGDYRLYDASDIERLTFIRGLRDDAGFSLAEIRELLEDESDRRRAREALAATEDPAERRSIYQGRLVRTDEQLRLLRAKVARLQEMVEGVERRRVRILGHLADLEEGGR